MIADYKPKYRQPLMLKGWTTKDHHYDKYDNYDAINVNRCEEIPIDYDGVIGVPITVLSYLFPDGKIYAVNKKVVEEIKKATPKSDFFTIKFNSYSLYCTQFEIVGITQRNDDPYKIKKYTKEEYENANDLNARGTIIVNGVPKSIYPRILIKKVF